MSWTTERFEQAAQMWSDGQSASEIAAKLGAGLTRSAVLSKMHRAGIVQQSPKHNRARKSHPPRVFSQFPTHPKPSRKSVARPPVTEVLGAPDGFVPSYEEIEIPKDQRKQLVDLEANECRWPIGDPQHVDFHFCARNKVTGLPYCEHHARKAFQPTSPVRQRPYKTEETTNRELVEA